MPWGNKSAVCISEKNRGGKRIVCSASHLKRGGKTGAGGELFSRQEEFITASLKKGGKTHSLSGSKCDYVILYSFVRGSENKSGREERALLSGGGKFMRWGQSTVRVWLCPRRSRALTKKKKHPWNMVELALA